MSWRHENWDAKSIADATIERTMLDIKLDPCRATDSAKDLVEAGFDACLEALFEAVGGEHDKGGGVLWFGKTDSGDILIYTTIPDKKS